jgi:hypothetical protein
MEKNKNNTRYIAWSFLKVTLLVSYAKTSLLMDKTRTLVPENYDSLLFSLFGDNGCIAVDRKAARHRGGTSDVILIIVKTAITTIKMAIVVKWQYGYVYCSIKIVKRLL